MKRTSRLTSVLLNLAPILLALLFTTLILVAVGASPWEAYRNILSGAFESPEKVADVVAACVPLFLCGVGVSITFTAGQWNVGVEGQIILGAIFATWVARTLPWPQVPVLTLMLVGGALGGALWGGAAGLLKVLTSLSLMAVTAGKQIFRLGSWAKESALGVLKLAAAARAAGKMLWGIYPAIMAAVHATRALIFVMRDEIESHRRNGSLSWLSLS